MKSPIEMETAAGGTIESSMRVIEVRIAELRQYFNGRQLAARQQCPASESDMP